MPGSAEKRSAPHSTGFVCAFATSADEPNFWRRLRAISELQCCRSRAIGTVQPSCPSSLPSAVQNTRSTCCGWSSVFMLGSAEDFVTVIVSTWVWVTRVSLGMANVSICTCAQRQRKKWQTRRVKLDNQWVRHGVCRCVRRPLLEHRSV